MSNIKPKNNNSKKTSREVQKVRVHQGSGNNAIPNPNILDLRSIVAKKELVRAQAKRRQTEASVQKMNAQDRSHNHKKKTEIVRKTKSLLSWWKKTPKLSEGAKPPRQSIASVPIRARTQSVVAPRPIAQHEEVTVQNAPHLIAADVLEVPRVPDLPQQSEHPKKQKRHRVSKRTRERSPYWQYVLKPTLIFAIFSLIFVLPASVSAMLDQAGSVKAGVQQSVEQAFQHLQNAGDAFQALNYEQAEAECVQALEGFTRAKSQFSGLSPLLVTIAPYIPVARDQLSSAQALIGAGEELALAGEQLSKGLAALSSVNLASVAQLEDGNLTTLLVAVHSALAPASEHITAASEAIANVTLRVVPEDKQQFVLLGREALPDIAATIQNGVSLTETLLALLGHEESKRYAVLFQNNHEMRPTGGFIGSLAFVDIQNGSVQSLDIPGGGVYDISGQLTEQVLSPEPMRLVNPHWNLQDANWFPHFPASAEKIQWFLDQSQGPAVDGVVTMVPSVVEKLLEITGPIDLLEEFDVIIDAENFYDEVQRRAEEKYDVTRESKKIIAVLTPKLLNGLFEQASDTDGLLRVVGILREALAEKDILVYMNDARLQNDFSARDWSGELKTTDRDYLGVFHANIGGGKTDDAVEQIVKHTAEIAADGSIVDSVTLTRMHKGASTDEFRAVNNVDFVRFYVPLGSTLLSVEGFNTPHQDLFLEPESGYNVDKDLYMISGEVVYDSENEVYINEEFEKTVFGGWIQTPSGESASVTLRYKLPFQLSVRSFWDSIDHYSLLVQKQPGSFGDFFTSEVAVSSELQVISSYPGEYAGRLQTVLEQDAFVGVVIGKR